MDSDDTVHHQQQQASLDAESSPSRKYRGFSHSKDRDSGEVKPRRQSVRTRPSLGNEHAEPLSPMLKDSAPTPQLQPRASKMSLFNLFSKPKVEKARGYAETGLAAPAPFWSKEANASKSQLAVQVGSNAAAAKEGPRTASSLGFRGGSMRPASRAATKTPVPQSVPTRNGSFTPPPLFQAYPQAARHGTLEVGTVSSEMVLQKSKNRKSGNLLAEPIIPRGSAEDGGSVETKRTARTTLRHVANGSITHVDMPKKVFVLVTSGFLLQYAGSGPSDRLPERVLQLGKDSAAFACDLIPGKHYVLQISQAVDQQGVVMANSGSIFSKLGLRSAAAKRMTSNFLLVMPNAVEMDSWMTAIREEIEALGGVRAKADTALRSKTRGQEDDMAELKKVPSKSQRYQVHRDPSKVSLVSNSLAEPVEPLPPPPRIRDDDERSETDTIDGIEQEAEQLAEDSRQSPQRRREEADMRSIRSSMAASVDQQRLNSLRSSQRTSHSTVATTVATSRTNSISGSPPSEHTKKESSEAPAESAQPKSPYRTLASYAIGRRRSAMPMTAQREALPALDVSPAINRHSTLAANVESPVTGRNSPLPISPRKLAVAASEPNLRAVADAKAKHDSKLSTPPTLSEELERPHSIVGDLPSPAAFGATKAVSPNRRTSLLQTSQAPPNAQRSSMVKPGPRNFDMVKPNKRHSSQPFSLPLKINPSTPENRPPTRNENRGSFNEIEQSTGEPVVHTLTAKVDASKRLSVSPNATSASSSSPKPDAPNRQPSRTPSGKLSLFPSQVPSPPLSTPALSGMAAGGATTEPLKRSPSATVISQSQAPAQASVRMLKRPTSMQVRSDRAPFLKGVRTSTGPPPATTRAFTAPIRSLKPSRSSIALSSKSAISQPSPTDPFTITSKTFDIPALPEEDGDRAMPLRAMSPLPSRPQSRASSRKVKTRSSLPELDLGIPVVGLGPPAPPPQAPLPAPPPASRPTSPMPNATGLGIRV